MLEEQYLQIFFLVGGTVPPNNFFAGGTVPPNDFLLEVHNLQIVTFLTIAVRFVKIHYSDPKNPTHLSLDREQNSHMTMLTNFPIYCVQLGE